MKASLPYKYITSVKNGKNYVNIIEYNQRKWNQEKEIKKRVILVEKMVEK